MVTYGYVLQHNYQGSGNFQIQVRIPSIHGPWNQKEYKGQPVRNYVRDEDLPWYPSMLLPYLPNKGEVVVITTLDEGKTSFLVIGLMGSNVDSSETNKT